MSQKIVQINNEPLPEIKPIGDQIAFKRNKKDANQNHMGQNHQETSPPNMERRSKSCTILWIYVCVFMVTKHIVIYTWKTFWVLKESFW